MRREMLRENVKVWESSCYKEQLLCSCPIDMAIFLKEHPPVDQKSMLDLAEKYEMVH